MAWAGSGDICTDGHGVEGEGTAGIEGGREGPHITDVGVALQQARRSQKGVAGHYARRRVRVCGHLVDAYLCEHKNIRK